MRRDAIAAASGAVDGGKGSQLEGDNMEVIVRSSYGVQPLNYKGLRFFLDIQVSSARLSHGWLPVLRIAVASCHMDMLRQCESNLRLSSLKTSSVVKLDGWLTSPSRFSVHLRREAALYAYRCPRLSIPQILRCT